MKADQFPAGRGSEPVSRGKGSVSAPVLGEGWGPSGDIVLLPECGGLDPTRYGDWEVAGLAKDF